MLSPARTALLRASTARHSALRATMQPFSTSHRLGSSRPDGTQDNHKGSASADEPKRTLPQKASHIV
ncbi:hypothetical protein GGH92_008029, partial [Coemansia sp. RSA 2673]